ncbi:DUF3093 family protein [Kineococcus aurantiacus]|uniref:DUF3093 domain-containing protein n=1 Tax=Kineococcus aurantiacus TaxID=37633 RepID=A0A7Y9DPL9_9ACTN|nr:hypothetical protein [Kineococcus aurantiacus]
MQSVTRAPRPGPGTEQVWDGRERWWPAATSWLSWLPAPVGGALVALPIWGPGGAAVGAAVGALAAVGVLLSLAWTTRLTDTEFRVGRARLPLDVVSGVDVVTRQERRAALGPGLDARAHLAIRSWIGTAVRIHLDDPADPTPYWVVSTRRPQRLAAEIRRRSRCR